MVRRLAKPATCAALAISIAVVLFAARGALFVLDPSETMWLARGDAAPHLVGWSFFSREPTSWPLARISQWPHPRGTTIGMTDSIPLVAIPLRAVAGPRAADAQYAGLWSALQVALLAVLAAALFRRFGMRPVDRWLASSLLASSPVLWDRFHRGHFSLTACFLPLLIALVFELAPGNERASLGRLAGVGAVPAFFALIHPYLFLTSLVLMVGSTLHATAKGRLAPWHGFGVLVLGTALGGLALHVGGFDGMPGTRLGAGGFGGYGSDALALLDPAGYSRWFPSLGLVRPSREGLAYPGLGVVFVMALAAAVHVAGWPASWKASQGTGLDRGVLWASVGLLACSMLPVLTVAGRPVLRVLPVHFWEIPVLQMVRANGRFCWSWVAAGSILAVRFLAQRVRWPKLLTLTLSVAAAIQVAEYRAPRTPRWPASGRILSGFRASPAAAAAPAAHLVMVPASLRDGGAIYCGSEQQRDSWIAPALFAATEGLTFNSGYVARDNATEAQEVCASARAVANGGALNREAAYLVPRWLARSMQDSSRAARCERVSRRDWLCFPR